MEQNRIGDQAAEAAEQGLQKARQFAEVASAKSRQALSTTDQWVRGNPWATVGIIAAVGLILGFLIGQGRRED